MNSVRAVILAAGRGSRMKHLTEDKPKCLVPLAGHTLLDWQCAALRAAGVAEILVIRGYLAEKLAGDYHVMDNPRWENTNMVRTLCIADQWLRKFPCIISYADIVYHPSHIQALIDAAGSIILTFDREWEQLWRLRFLNPLEDAETFQEEHGILRTIGGKTSTTGDIAGQYMGLLKITPTGWESMHQLLNALPQERIDRLDMTGMISLLLKEGGMVHVIPVSGQWCEVDSDEDITLYNRLIVQVDTTQRFWVHDWRWNQ